MLFTMFAGVNVKSAAASRVNFTEKEAVNWVLNIYQYPTLFCNIIVIFHFSSFFYYYNLKFYSYVYKLLLLSYLFVKKAEVSFLSPHLNFNFNIIIKLAHNRFFIP